MASMNISLPDQMKLQKLREALIEGENSGLSTGLDIDKFIASKKKSLSL